MRLCTDSTHPRKKDGTPKAKNNCRYCSVSRNCFDQTHPRTRSGKVPTKLACYKCTPHRFCFDHHSKPRTKVNCVACNPKNFCLMHPTMRNGAIVFRTKTRCKVCHQQQQVAATMLRLLTEQTSP